MNQHPSLKIIFAGTPAFSVPTLDALIHSEHHIQAVYTQPDRPAGRGRQLTLSPVKQLAQQHHLPIYQPVTLRDESEQKILVNLNADVMIVVAYGLLLPKVVLNAPRFGCLNIHASLLPRWRGAAPIQRAILAGDSTTGITIMQMDEGLDTGAMLQKIACPILANDTSQTLHDRLAILGKETLLKTLENLSQNLLNPEVQDSSIATYAAKMTKEEARLNWQLSAIELERKVRAFNPWPIAFIENAQTTLRIFSATILENETHATPGTILNAGKAGLDIATSKGIFRILTAQLPGGRVLPIADILNAHRDQFKPGMVLA